MPYRSDSRDDAERRLQEATEALSAADGRVRAVAARLKRLTLRFERELAEADQGVAEAEAAWRGAVRRALARSTEEHAPVRAALRSAGVVAALEAALRRRRRGGGGGTGPAPASTGPSPSQPPAHVEQLEARLARARKARARLAAQREATLDATRRRMRELVVEHDEARERADSARARVGALSRGD